MFAKFDLIHFPARIKWIFSLCSMSCDEVMRVWRREVRLVMRTQQMRLLSVRDSNQSKLTTLDTSFLEQPAIFSKLQIKTRASNETFPPLISARPRNFFSCCFCSWFSCSQICKVFEIMTRTIPALMTPSSSLLFSSIITLRQENTRRRIIIIWTVSLSIFRMSLILFTNNLKHEIFLSFLTGKWIKETTPGWFRLFLLFCCVTIIYLCSVQEERRYGAGRTPGLSPQEAPLGFYGPPTSYTSGYF